MNSEVPASSSCNRAQTILGAALEHAQADREAFLQTACGDDIALLAEVRSMLATHAAAPTGFMPDDVTVRAAPGMLPAQRGPLTSEQEGEMIGPYKLLQEIGEGGFGSVWMAEQSKPISRKVALKVIKMGMDTKEVIARFEAERQALAMMDHPNIAKVLDAGATGRGSPYFVMELVKGLPITRYCDEAGLGIRERLALFGDVCSAINHAHQKGIIHRDIKPSNVMVTLHGDKPVVKVIDFGIAKATQGKLTDRTLFTRFEQFIGTPVYMSPEQASLSGLDIDTRSDVYALGILLYELLAGKPPFDPKTLISSGYEEMRRIIREVEPVKPSSRLSTAAGEERTRLAKARQVDEGKLSKLVEPDLDWIVMKAIEKDRTRRYETANAFAQDILRFLADETVTARPPSAGYQLRKFARRHKGAFRIAALISLLLIAATLVSGWQALRATKAEALANERLAESEKARAEAEAISKFLTGMFESSQPGKEKGGREVKVADVLDIAAKKLETELADQPERRAQLQGTLGGTYYALGLFPQAIVLQEQARNHYQNTHGPEHVKTLDAMNALAISYASAGRREEALRTGNEVAELRRKVLGPEHPATLIAMHNLANIYSTIGRRDEELKLREGVLTLRRKVLGTKHPDTLLAMNNLAHSYVATDRQEESLKIREEVLALHRKLNGSEHPFTLRAMHNLASSYDEAARKDEALKLKGQVLMLHRKVLGPEHPDTLMALHNLANSYDEAGRKDEALKLREEVLTLRRKVLGPEHLETLAAMGNLANSYDAADFEDDALKLREEVLTLRRKVLGTEHPETLNSLNNLAASHYNAGRKDLALKLTEEVLALRRNVLGPEHPDTLKAMTNLAVVYDAVGRKDEASKLRSEVEALKENK